ncbi:MAG TPA: lysylphosphatidylglycerol synthase domain-containing protein, partial [Bacillota bacterium]
RFAVLARERYQHLPGTLVVINHQSDWDGPIVGGLVCLISGPRGVGRRTSFLTRGDLGRPDFIPKYLLPGRGWARVLLGRVSLAPIIEALGVRSVPSLDDPLAGTRRERVRMVRAALDRAAFELDRGGCVMVAPEGRFTPDGALAPISGSVARLGPHARVIQPVTITYDPTQPGRTGLTVNFQDPIFPAGYAAGDFLEEEVSRRLRSGIVFGLGQMAGLLATAGLPAEAALRNLTPDHLAGAVAGLSVALSAAGRTVDPSLLRITSAGLWRRWRRWKARGSAGPVGEPATHRAGNRAPWALAYWSRQAADALRDLPGPERERVFGTAAAWARAVTTGAATAGAAAADAADDVAGARVGVGRARLRLWLARVEPWLRPIGTTAVFILTVLAVGYMFRKVPFNKVVEATRGYSLSWMVVGLTLNLAGYFTRVPVWRAFLEEAPRPVSTREVFDLYIGGAFINNFVPLRGGDVARVVYLAKQMGLGWGRGVTLVAAEHAFDLVVIGGYGVVGVLLTPAAPVWAGHLVGA